ncbi:FecR family protein [Pedobacter sp. L105]|uniref:FecR family protein n=1 Tax=Pedobacter sp. L105 TaxID=1641871 RepID=UPI00131CEDDC|nr:FecR domain-containing protein [Pedobacter sp. L105]
MEMNDDILISYLLGETSPEQAKLVNEWRKRSEINNARFNQFELIWETSLNLKFDGSLDVQASLHRLREKAAAQKNSGAKVVSLQQRNPWLKIAAAILLLVGCGLFYFYQFNVPEIQFATNKEIKADTLSDGSIVTLNKSTVLKYPKRFNGKQRSVILAKGEAFFNVAHNKQLPFIIAAGRTSICVVGTSFNVKNKNGNVEVIVETGVVQVTRNGHRVLLKRGEKVLVKQNETSFKKENNPDQLYNYYRSKEIVANNTPLWRVVEILNEAYDCKIVLGRKELNDLPLNTTFKDQSLDNVLAVISRTFKVTVERKRREIVLK